MTGIDRDFRDETHDNQRVGVVATILSVLAAFFGVQSSRARKRDFSHGSPVLFIGIALALTVGFVLTLVLIVQLLIRQAGMG